MNGLINVVEALVEFLYTKFVSSTNRVQLLEFYLSLSLGMPLQRNWRIATNTTQEGQCYCYFVTASIRKFDELLFSAKAIDEITVLENA